MGKYILVFVWLAWVCFLGSSCDIINPEEDVPAYLYIDDYKLNTLAGQGSDAHKITDAWVFVNSDILGVYPLPATVPILESGSTDIVIFPGIKENGLQNAPLIYPFYERYTMTLDLQPGAVDSMQFTTEYTDKTVFSFVEGFEGGHIFTDDIDGNPQTSISLVSDGAFEGQSAMIVIDTINPLVQVATGDFYTEIPIDGTDVFLEMHYKTDVELQIGLIGEVEPGETATAFVYTLFPKSEWNKTHINFAETLVLSQLDAYKVVFRAILPIENGTFSKEEAAIYLDNLKLVHF